MTENTRLVPKYDFIIIGTGCVGLFLALQLKNKHPKSKILLIEKEKAAGLHTSGRNSGVLHAGLYYEPGSIKAKVCVDGAKRLRNWILDRDLPLNQCGKIIIPQSEKLDAQLDVLAARGKANGAYTELINESELYSLFPAARSSTGRALWSPNTCVADPKSVIKQLTVASRYAGAAK